MNKQVWKIVSAIILLALVGYRFYLRYERQQMKEKQQKEQQEFINKQLEITLKKEREKKELEWKKAQQKRLDSLDSIRRAQYDENMRKLKEAQKKLQEEIDKKKEKE